MKKVLLITCLLAACKTTPTNPDAKPDGASEPDLPTQWFVWTKGEAGLETLRIEGDRKGGFKVIGKAEGAWVGTPDGQQAKIWEFDSELVPSTETDCDCEDQATLAGEEKACDQPVEREVAVVRAFPTGPVLQIPAAGSFDSETRAINAGVDGTAGPYLFATACLDQYACGAAHGDSLCDQTIFDLSTGGEVNIYDLAAKPLRGPEQLQFVREAYDDELEAQELAEEDVVFSWVAPTYEQRFVPRMDEQYTGPACYACSDGLWDSYTISTRRTVDALPTVISAWLKETPAPPDAVTESLNAQIGGWSLVPPDAALRKHLDAVF